MFCLRDTATRIGVAFTDRHGGVSAAPYDSLNLARAAGDEGSSVERNFALVADALGTAPDRLVRMHQVHGADVAVVREPAPCERQRPRADALVTDEPGLVLTVRVADCVPVLLGDAQAGVAGCVHAGRAGLAAGVVSRAVEVMRTLGAEEVRAWVGPYVCGRCYEVPERLRDDVAAVVPEARATTSWGTPALDIGAGVRAQLSTAGCAVVATPRFCTRESPDLFSYRRDGRQSGRTAGLVWVRP